MRTHVPKETFISILMPQNRDEKRLNELPTLSPDSKLLQKNLSTMIVLSTGNVFDNL